MVVDNRLDGGDNDGNDIDVGDIDGFVATVGTPDFLAFLNPTLQFVYGSPDGTGDATYYRAIRGELTPLTGEFLFRHRWCDLRTAGRKRERER